MALSGFLTTGLTQTAFASSSNNIIANDTYLQGMAAYQAELKKAGATNLSQALDNYVNEVHKTERQVGYIGPKIQLPKPTKVADGVYTIVGSLIWHNPSNYGLNNNLTFIEFEDGVFVFNAGPNPAVAAAFHRVIKEHTNKPVKWVAVENSQGHAYLGASYWVDIGVKNLYSHDIANRDFHNAFNQIKARWARRVGHELTDSARDVSDKFTTFADKLVVKVGKDESIEILNFGPGHTPGSTVVYIPKRNIVLPGDLAYRERMLALFSYTDTFSWVNTFENFMQHMPKDVLVIPGHGKPSTLEQVKTDTYDYLKFMHKQVQAHVDAGGTEAELDNIDQSTYKNRPVYDQTHHQNAVHIYKEITGGDLGQSFE